MEIVKTEKRKQNSALDYLSIDSPPLCGNCPYWSERQDITARDPNGMPGGDCRIDPPKNIPMPFLDRLGHQQIAINAFYPSTMADCW